MAGFFAAAGFVGGAVAAGGGGAADCHERLRNVGVSGVKLQTAVADNVVGLEHQGVFDVGVVDKLPDRGKERFHVLVNAVPDSATDADGKRMKYRVAHEVARAVNFREATFSGMLDAPQQDGKMAWLVTFTLAEHVSVQEKREARATGKTTAKKQTASSTGQSAGQNAGEDEEKLTWFERRVLKPVNDALG